MRACPKTSIFLIGLGYAKPQRERFFFLDSPIVKVCSFIAMEMLILILKVTAIYFYLTVKDPRSTM